MLNAYSFLYVAKSGNKKTGVMSQVYTAGTTNIDSSCPVRCPFKNSGCYAEQFHCRLAWKKATKNIEELKKAVQAKHTDLIRHNVAGDLATPGTSDINPELLQALNDVYQDCNAYTYTHCEVNNHNINLVKASRNLKINFSCETLDQVKQVKQAGCAAVMAVEKMTKPIMEKDGLLFVLCPSQKTGGLMHCDKCRACSNLNRKAVIVFEAHGNGKKKTTSFLSEL